MKTLSKSKLLAYRQCPKRLWLEVHSPELRADSVTTQASFATGNVVGATARTLYDPKAIGTELELDTLGMSGLLAKTRELLKQRLPIFEAGFVGAAGPDGGALALADILLPDEQAGPTAWRMVEVKSSSKVKDYHRDDAVIQHYVATQAGVNLSGIALAHIDSSWTYPGGDDYTGLLVEHDLTGEATARSAEVQAWITEAHQVVAQVEAPEIGLGDHCGKPFACGFNAHCVAQDEIVNGTVELPVHWLPNIRTRALKEHVALPHVRSLIDVPDELLNPIQLRVKHQTLSQQVFFDGLGAAKDLAPHNLPALFLDFETIAYAVPIWAGTRPYQVVPFQFSLHRLDELGRAEHTGFLDLSGQDPSAAFAAALIEACKGDAPIFVYAEGFEGARISQLAIRFPHLSGEMLALMARLVDLLPVTRAYYYHPSQQGSWSIKAVLPAVAPELRYGDLDGVQDGGGAQMAFLEAVHADTPAHRKQEIWQQLWSYCRLDTFAMIRLWAHLAGRNGLISLSDNAPSIVLQG